MLKIGSSEQLAKLYAHQFAEASYVEGFHTAVHSRAELEKTWRAAAPEADARQWQPGVSGARPRLVLATTGGHGPAMPSIAFPPRARRVTQAPALAAARPHPDTLHPARPLRRVLRHPPEDASDHDGAPTPRLRRHGQAR